MGLFVGFIFIYLGFISSPLRADQCVKKGPCTCEFSNGTGFDLTPTANNKFFTAQIYQSKMNGTQLELSTYYYHPCYDILPKINASKPTDTCGVPLSICRSLETLVLNGTGIYRSDGGRNDFMGTSNVSEFLPDGRSIKYMNGPSNSLEMSRSTQVLLVCADTEDDLHIYSLLEPNAIVLSFYSRNACLKQIEPPGRSLGSTLLIVFFSCVIFYLVLGVCTKKFLMGATGLEVVPNLAFWTDLPNLVKDGWAFTISGFKLPPRASGHVTSPDPNSYDSI